MFSLSLRKCNRKIILKHFQKACAFISRLKPKMQCLREKGMYSAKRSAKSAGYNEPRTPEVSAPSHR